MLRAAGKAIAIHDGVVVVVTATTLTISSSLSRWQRATTEVLLFPQPTEHVAHHRRCRQPQRPQSGNGRSSLPLLHKADVVSSGARSLATRLSDHRRCRCATLVAPPPLVCRPLRFADSLSRRLHLLSRYCAPLVQLVVVLPVGLPLPLSRRLPPSSRLSIRGLSRRVASHCLAPWPPLPLSSCLRLSLRHSR